MRRNTSGSKETLTRSAISLRKDSLVYAFFTTGGLFFNIRSSKIKTERTEANIRSSKGRCLSPSIFFKIGSIMPRSLTTPSIKEKNISTASSDDLAAFRPALIENNFLTPLITIMIVYHLDENSCQQEIMPICLLERDAFENFEFV